MNKTLLIEILLDPNSSDSEKDDAVIHLGNNFEDERTIDLLIQVSNNMEFDGMIAASCGESLGQIWLRKRRINFEKLFWLKGSALNEALSLIKAQRIDWYEEYIEMTLDSKDKNITY
ncbi:MULTISPECIES: hypothetical protein [unclassified Paenibacillus]|uniref:hypothetical protein n=1 Tax=unclassified Paenibacillus TaxID=185978 RepID=UPI00096BF2E0|nr:hypothetical protein [Paenibacillus sp. FSL H8-0259]OMF25853.1 hypothetical protein BK132_19825 [Paenibacillus sp. FSL H8-0259]